MELKPPHSLVTRPTLLFKLRSWEDSASWFEFYHLYRKLVFGLARRAGLSHEEAEEVTQDVFKRVAETIEQFELNPKQGSFRGWLMNLTRWRITDKFRRRPREEAKVNHPSTGEREPIPSIEQIGEIRDSEGDLTREWQEQLVKAALVRVSRRCPPKNLQIFELYTNRDWSALRIAKELRVNPATVYVIVHRITRQLKKEVTVLKETLN